MKILYPTKRFQSEAWLGQKPTLAQIQEDYSLIARGRLFSRQYEYWICSVVGWELVAVRSFTGFKAISGPKEIRPVCDQYGQGLGSSSCYVQWCAYRKEDNRCISKRRYEDCTGKVVKV